MPWNSERAAALLLLFALCPLLALFPACNGDSGKIALGGTEPAAEAAAGSEQSVPVSAQRLSAEVTTASEEIVFETVGSFQGWQEVTVSCEVDGKIDRIPVEIGQRVNKGDLLALLEETDFKLGVARAEAGLDMAKADRDNAKNDYERKEQLYKDNTIPKSNFDSFVTRLAQAEANLRMAEAVLAQARHHLTKARITAPAAGYVGQKLVAEGEFLSMSSGYEMIRLVVDRPMKLVFEVPEKLGVRITTGEPVEAKVAAFGDRLFSGTIHAVSPSASIRTRTIPVEAKFDNRAGELKSGFFASVSLRLPRGDQMLQIPRDAVRRNEIGESYVDLADGDSTRQVVVNVAGTEGSNYLVTGDLAAGDTVLYH
jgi:membrane fusion protein (multidrug efflux system)